MRPRKGWVTEETAKAVEHERLEAMAATPLEVLAAEIGVPLKAAMEAMQTARAALAAACGMPDPFRHGPIVTLTAEQLRKRYTTVDEEEFHETGQDGTRVLRRRLVAR